MNIGCVLWGYHDAGDDDDDDDICEDDDDGDDGDDIEYLIQSITYQ